MSEPNELRPRTRVHGMGIGNDTTAPAPAPPGEPMRAKIEYTVEVVAVEDGIITVAVSAPQGLTTIFSLPWEAQA